MTAPLRARCQPVWAGANVLKLSRPQGQLPAFYGKICRSGGGHHTLVGVPGPSASRDGASRRHHSHTTARPARAPKQYGMRIALFGNIYQTRKNIYVRAVLDKLRGMKADICIEREFAAFVGGQLGVDVSQLDIIDPEALQADFVISIGGDGTFLSTAASVGARAIPILGINTGRLGFLADVSPEDVDLALDAICVGDYVVEHRAVISLSKDGPQLAGYPYALNEVAVLKHDNSSLIEINTYINGALLANYLADGLIISTPTGSTGYSLSVGGPIIMPRSGTFCISPVASHSLSSRPVVICDDMTLTLKVRSRSHNFLVSVDGRSESLPDDTTITLRRAPYTIGVMKVKHKDFFDTLRDKMMWGADQRF